MAEKTIPFKLPPGSGGLNLRQKAVLVLGGLAALAGISLMTWFSMTTYVEVDEFAVKQVYFGSGQGVQKELYGPGLQFVIPGYERLHVFPRGAQSLEMNASSEPYRRRNVLEAPAIRIQTSEGYQVTVDISVVYRIVEPYKVLTEVGPGRLYETKVVSRRADKILRQTFGRLKAEDFFSETERIKTAEEARTLLQKDLRHWGIDVWGVLVRNYTYDERYQQAIEDRKIQDEKVHKNIAEANADGAHVVLQFLQTIAGAFRSLFIFPLRRTCKQGFVGNKTEGPL